MNVLGGFKWKSCQICRMAALAMEVSDSLASLVAFCGLAAWWLVGTKQQEPEDLLTQIGKHGVAVIDNIQEQLSKISLILTHDQKVEKSIEETLTDTETSNLGREETSSLQILTYNLVALRSYNTTFDNRIVSGDLLSIEFTTAAQSTASSKDQVKVSTNPVVSIKFWQDFMNVGILNLT